MAPVNKRLMRLAGGGLILLGILLLAGGVGLFLSPKSFQAISILKVDTEALNDLSRVTRPPTQVFGFGGDPGWTQDEFELVESKPVLYCVITNLNLNRRWAGKFNGGEELPTVVSYARLKKQIDVRKIGNGGGIEIRARAADRNEAAAIANE